MIFETTIKKFKKAQEGELRQDNLKSNMKGPLTKVTDDIPSKRASAREFLVETLKVGDDYPSTTLNDVVSAEDMKYILEGGGGLAGDPINTS